MGEINPFKKLENSMKLNWYVIGFIFFPNRSHTCQEKSDILVLMLWKWNRLEIYLSLLMYLFYFLNGLTNCEMFSSMCLVFFNFDVFSSMFWWSEISCILQILLSILSTESKLLQLLDSVVHITWMTRII